MRRNQSVEVNHVTINIHDIEIDTTAYTVSIEGTPIDLTKTEHELLYLLVKNKGIVMRSEEHTSELQSRFDLVCRLLLEKKKTIIHDTDCKLKEKHES